MDSEQIIRDELEDEADGRPTLLFLGFDYGIGDRPANIAERCGNFVRLTKRGRGELARNNRPEKRSTVLYGLG